jgi:non-homologous end joining protein Ku/predicted HicB family RNase H-like nuclease
MSTVQYRGYQGDVVFEGDRLLLRILHIDDFITAEVDRASEVESAFAELVDDYLASCAELGKSPDRPFKGLFNVRVSPDLHRQAAFAAANERLTLNGFVTSALHEKLAKDLSHEEVQVREPERVGEGFLRLSLVTCPVQILPAIGGPGELELDHGMLIEIDHFIPKHAVDSLYRSTAYYVTPLGKVGHDAYAVIRETIKATDKTAWVTLRAPGFERSCFLEARGNGMLLTALRPSSSIRNADNIFGSIQKVKVGQDMIDLATHIVDQKTGTFDPQAIKQEAIARREENEAIPPGDKKSRKSGNVINLMEALKRSQKAALDDKKGARRKA